MNSSLNLYIKEKIHINAISLLTTGNAITYLFAILAMESKRFQLYLCLMLWTSSLVDCLSRHSFEKVGDFTYYIGEENNIKGFNARKECRSNGGQLASVVSETQMNDLQKYIIDRGYANGSRFSTSGHSFLSPESFKWDGLQAEVEYSKWLPGDGPDDSSFLSLQLIDSELFMVTYSGFDDYYICEYETRYQKLRKILRNTDFVFRSVAIIVIIILALIIIFLSVSSKWKTKDYEQFGHKDHSEYC